jgi:hypothetical protein
MRLSVLAFLNHFLVLTFPVLMACQSPVPFSVDAALDPLGEADAGRGATGNSKSDGFTCAGACGTQSPNGCWCDDLCSSFGDCCSDKEAVCDKPPQADASVCVPECGNLQCGPDPLCGTECGICGTGSFCDQGSCTSSAKPWLHTNPAGHGGGTENGRGQSQAVGVAIAGQGRVVYAGTLRGEVTFGNTSMMALPNTTDGFVAQLDAKGDHQWSNQISSNHDVWVSDVATDAVGNIYLGGTYRQEAYVAGSYVGNSCYKERFLFAKFDAQGSVKWVLENGGAGETASPMCNVGGGANLRGMAVDKTGNAYLLIYSTDGYFLLNGQSHSMEGRFALLKVDALGKYQWHLSYRAGLAEAGFATYPDIMGHQTRAQIVRVNESGKVHLLGLTPNLIKQRNPASSVFAWAKYYKSHLILAEVDPLSGKFAVVAVAADDQSVVNVDFLVDGQGNIFWALYAYGKMRLGPQSYVQHGGFNLVKYDSNLLVKWVQPFAEASDDCSHSAGGKLPWRRCRLFINQSENINLGFSSDVLAANPKQRVVGFATFDAISGSTTLHSKKAWALANSFATSYANAVSFAYDKVMGAIVTAGGFNGTVDFDGLNGTTRARYPTSTNNGTPLGYAIGSSFVWKLPL